MVGSIVKIVLIYGISFFLLLFSPNVLSARGQKEVERPVEDRVITELQDKYTSMDNVPGIIMLPVSATSAVPSEWVVRIEKELSEQLVNNGNLKPVLMQKWLFSTYGKTKANNPFALMNTVKSEQYIVPVGFIAKANIFKSDDWYGFFIKFYSLANYYPVTVFRIFSSADDLSNVIVSCLAEMERRLFQTTSGDAKKRIVIDTFKLELLRLAELQTGEFDFISTPFIEKSEVPIRANDEFFSSLLGYILSTTGLLNVMYPKDFAEYSNSVISSTTSLVDYRIQGKVQISEQECVVYIDLLDIHNNAIVISLRYPMLEYSLETIWNVYRDISVYIIGKIFNEDKFGVVPALSAPGQFFFANDQFVGWDTLENFVLAKSIHKISVENYLPMPNDEKIPKTGESGSVPNTYYILFENIIRVYTGREGEHIWNLLKK
jgi:hypothetical protein